MKDRSHDQSHHERSPTSGATSPAPIIEQCNIVIIIVLATVTVTVTTVKVTKKIIIVLIVITIFIVLIIIIIVVMILIILIETNKFKNMLVSCCISYICGNALTRTRNS